MSVKKPQDINKAFADAYNSGSVERLLELYEPDAILAPKPGERAVGLEAIKGALTELIYLGEQMHSENHLCMEFDNIAMLRAKFKLSGAGEDGNMEVEGFTSEVVRQQSDGTWLYVIDHPFGSDEAV